MREIRAGGGRALSHFFASVPYGVLTALVFVCIAHASPDVALQASRYVAPDGASLEVMPAGQSADLLVRVSDPGVLEMTVVVPRAADARPREMTAETTFGDQPLALAGVGSDLYGATTLDGQRVEFLVGEGGRVRTAVDGKPRKGPPAERDIELELVAEEFAQTWNALRAAQFNVSSDAASVRGSAPAPRAFARVEQADEALRARLEAEWKRHNQVTADAVKLKKTLRE